MASCSAKVYVDNEHVYSFHDSAEGNYPGRYLLYGLVANLLFELEEANILPQLKESPDARGHDKLSYQDKLLEEKDLRDFFQMYYWKNKNLNTSISTLQDISEYYSAMGAYRMAILAQQSKLGMASFHCTTTHDFEEIASEAYSQMSQIYGASNSLESARMYDLFSRLSIETLMTPHVTQEQALASESEVVSNVQARVQRNRDQILAEKQALLQVVDLAANLATAGLSAPTGSVGDVIQQEVRAAVVQEAKSQLMSFLVTAPERQVVVASGDARHASDTEMFGLAQITMQYYVAQIGSAHNVARMVEELYAASIEANPDLQNILNETSCGNNQTTSSGSLITELTSFGGWLDETWEHENTVRVSELGIRYYKKGLQSVDDSEQWSSIGYKTDWGERGSTCSDSPSLRGDYEVRTVLYPMLEKELYYRLSADGYSVTFDNYQEITVRNRSRQSVYVGWRNPDLPMILHIVRFGESLSVTVDGVTIYIEDIITKKPADCLNISKRAGSSALDIRQEDQGGSIYERNRR